MNFVPQQKIEINPLIKMNCTISKNNDKNLFTVDNGKEKRKEKIEENQTILGSKINVNKEGLGYVPKIKKKYDVITMNFVPQQKIDLNPLIKMNCLTSENTNKNPVNIHNRKEKGKEKIEENKINKKNLKKIENNKVKSKTK